MNNEKYIKSVIVENFKDFYEALLVSKAMALAEKGDEVPSVPQQILNRLEALLQSQYAQMETRGGALAAQYYQEAQYVMAALTDETFINLQWKGKKVWEDNLLESRLYNTQDAGDEFFKKLNAFLETRDHTSSDVAMVYLLSLGLGFQGKFRGEEDQKILSQYKKNLYGVIEDQPPQFLEGYRKFFPQAYAFTLDPRSPSEAPNTQAWYYILATTAVGFVIAFYILWYVEVKDLYTVIDAIHRLIRAEG